jgi:hypothetical protein
MRKICFIICLLLTVLQAETLFQVKDSQDRVVLDVSSDGLRVLNEGDTVMVISSSEIKAVIDDSKALSRSFTVATSTSAKGLYNALEVNTGSTTMSAGDGEYTNFSPKNIFLGLNAGASVTIGDPYAYSGLYNLFIGNHAGQSLTSGYFNTFTGYQAGNSSTIATHNSFYGYQAGMNNTIGSYNTAIGFQAGYEMSEGLRNNMIGYKAGYLTSSGTDNIFVGTEAGWGNSSGDYNIAMGYHTGHSLSGGNSNIFMGNESGYSNTNGHNNLFLGFQSGYNTIDGDNNIFIGYEAGEANTSGNNNTFMGYQSGKSNTTGNYNLFMGYSSGALNVSGQENMYIGYASGMTNSAGTGNTCLGTYSGQVLTGGENVMIGRGAGCYATSANNNVFIGSYAGYGNSTNDGNVFIGDKVGYSNVGSNKLMIDNSDVNSTTALIYGDFANDELTVNGTLTSSGNMYMNGTSLQILTNPGTGTTPTNYVYQGSGLGSTSKQYAFAVNDALWVTSNAYIDGTTNMTDRLVVENSGTGINGATGYFENTNSLGIGLAAFATSTDVALYAEQKNTTSTTANIAKFASQYGGWSEKFIFRSTGRFYTPYLASGTGTYLQITSGGEIVKYSSSKKYKKDIEKLSVDRSKFMNLEPVSFKWNEKSATEGKSDYGLIAEEVEKIDPLLAIYNEEGEIEGVDYQKINIMLLKVVQEQQVAIKELEKRLEVIEKAQQ